MCIRVACKCIFFCAYICVCGCIFAWLSIILCLVSKINVYIYISHAEVIWVELCTFFHSFLSYTYPRTNQAQCCLTLVIRWEPVCSTWYSLDKWKKSPNHIDRNVMLYFFSKIYGEQARFFDMEQVPRIKHKKRGLLSMVNNGSGMHGSQVELM